MKNPSDQKQVSHSHSLKKEERLRSQKLIEKLFAEGASFLVYPYKVVYYEVDVHGDYPALPAFAVSKKNFRKAVHRNRIKRLMRESYRINKHMLFSEGGPSKKAIMFIYVGKEILTFKVMEKAMIRALNQLRKQVVQDP